MLKLGWIRAVLTGVLLALASASSIAAQSRITLETPEASDDLRRDLRAASLVFQTQAEGVTDPAALLAAAQADYARLLAVLYDQGRFAGVISIRVNGREAASYTPLARLGAVRDIRLRVEPGPVYRFGRVGVAPLPARTPRAEGFRSGAPASTEAIRDAASQAVEHWREAGHAKAEITGQDIVARHGDRSLDARLTVTPGPRLTFGRVTVRGNTDVRTRRILKIAGLEEGRRFDPEVIARAEKRLRRTCCFASVSVEEGDTVGPGATLPLTIGVAEATPRRLGFGAEYSTVEGLRLSGFWLHRNFLGGAERFRVDGAISGIAGETGGTDFSFGARYERPATPAADTDFFAAFSFEALDEPDFTSDTSEFTLGFTRYASDRTTVELGLGYLYSETTDDFGAERIELLTLPFSGTHDRRDNALDPTHGFYADLEVTPFLGIEGTSDGARIALDARAYRGTETLTFAGRMQLGALLGPSLENSPAFYRFYSGGGGTVRGQDFQSLGADVGAITTGGRSRLVLSGEVRADVTDKLQLVGFADWGYVGAESFPDFSGNSHAGAGLGLRYQTGIGPIRLDVATPVAGDTEASDFYIYIGIGQAF